LILEIVETPEKFSEESSPVKNVNITPSKSFAPTHPSVRQGLTEKLKAGKTAAAAHRFVGILLETRITLLLVHAKIWKFVASL